MAKSTYRYLLNQWPKELEEERKRHLDLMPEDKKVELEKHVELGIASFSRTSKLSGIETEG